MKRLGVQLAGSGIVVLLGALGVAQAQRDSHNEEAAQWEQQAAPAMTPPPAPIAAVEDETDAPRRRPAPLVSAAFNRLQPLTLISKPFRMTSRLRPVQPAK